MEGPERCLGSGRLEVLGGRTLRPCIPPSTDHGACPTPHLSLLQDINQSADGHPCVPVTMCSQRRWVSARGTHSSAAVPPAK